MFCACGWNHNAMLKQLGSRKLAKTTMPVALLECDPLVSLLEQTHDGNGESTEKPTANVGRFRKEIV